MDGDQFSQEFHLSGGDDSQNWLLGVYYLDDDRDSTSSVVAFELGGPDTVANVATTSYAVFGEVNRTLSDTLSMVAGFRYTDEEKEIELTTMDGDNGDPDNGIPPSPTFMTYLAGSDRLTGENLSGKLGLEWRPAMR